MDPMEALYVLQEIDVELKSVKEEQAASRELSAVVRANQRVKQATAERDALAEEAVSQQKRIKRLELDLNSVESEMEAIQRKMFDGDVTSPKELAGFQERLDSHSHQKGRLEEDVLNALDALEEQRQKVERIEGRITDAENELKDAQDALAQAGSTRSDRARQLEVKRAEVVEVLPPDLLSRYETLYTRLAGRPVAQIANRTCKGCHVNLPTAVKAPKPSEILRCPNCNRLLWWPRD